MPQPKKTIDANNEAAVREIERIQFSIDSANASKEKAETAQRNAETELETARASMISQGGGVAASGLDRDLTKVKAQLEEARQTSEALKQQQQEELEAATALKEKAVSAQHEAESELQKSREWYRDVLQQRREASEREASEREKQHQRVEEQFEKAKQNIAATPKLGDYVVCVKDGAYGWFSNTKKDQFGKIVDIKLTIRWIQAKDGSSKTGESETSLLSKRLRFADDVDTGYFGQLEQPETTCSKTDKIQIRKDLAAALIKKQYDSIPIPRKEEERRRRLFSTQGRLMERLVETERRGYA